MITNIQIVVIILICFSARIELQNNTRLSLGTEEGRTVFSNGQNMLLNYDGVWRNGLRAPERRWPNAVVPYIIEEEQFSENELDEIMAAIGEFHTRTTIRFRPYKKGDRDYLVIKGSKPGCWTTTGRKGGPQVLNVNNGTCLKHGKIVHELLHALGFKHQHSSHDRDRYVRIIWKNIKEGQQHNFIKLPISKGTNFGIPYDYASVMHYGPFSFSKNKKNMKRTIIPKDWNATIGQRKGLSEKDILKLNMMYKMVVTVDVWKIIIEELEVLQHRLKHQRDSLLVRNLNNNDSLLVTTN